ncbi:MAG: hypothetical protein FJZ01_14505 [Candidatus Sericytochromatia bacterium]|nr:hypothetical protein [Candidatus Tanganyikabacteria bacterium]
MSTGQNRDKGPSGFLNSLLGNLGLAKPAPQAPARPGTPGDRMVPRTGRETNPMAAGPKATQPLSEAEKAKQSEERRYLIAAFEATPTLIPEFQNPQYMYKLISNERDYVQENLNKALAERKKLFADIPDDPTPAQQAALDRLDAKVQEYRNDLTRLFLLIKKVAGVQKSGTGGTDFLTSG